MKNRSVPPSSATGPMHCSQPGRSTRTTLLKLKESSSWLPPSSHEKDSGACKMLIQELRAARAACWLAICSFIFCCISLG